MDFSSLDLLASTALRDNNPSQADSDTTPADPHHPQHSHHGSVESDEDDDEADGNGVKEASEAASTEVGDSVQEEDMGSVKCGKHKKNSANAKPMSIFVRDGKCVAKHLSTKPMGGEVVTGDCKKTGVAHKVTPEQEGNSGGQNTAVDSTGSVSPKCPQPMEVDAQKTDSPAQPSLNGIISHGCQTTVPALTDDRAESSPQKLNPNVEAAVLANGDSKSISCNAKASQQPGHEQEHCGQSAEKDSDTQHVPAAASPIPTAAAPTCQGDERPTTEQPPKQSTDSDCSHTDPSGSGAGDSQSSVLHADTDMSLGVLKSPQDQGNDSDKVPSDCVSCSAPDGTNPQQNMKDSDKISSDCVNISVPDGEKSLCSLSKNAEAATETGTPNLCDEDLTVMYSCSQTQVKAAGQNSPCQNSVDQDIGSLGRKEPQSSSTSTSDDGKTVLSPPPPPPPSSGIALLDHTYCCRSKKLLEHTDDSGDAFESADENLSADETERRPRSLSVDSVYLKYSLAGLPSQQDVLSAQNDKLALLSPTLSVDSISNDSSLSEHSTAAGGQSQSYSILMGSPTPKLKGTSSRPNLAFMDSQGKLAAGGDGVCRMGTSMLEADSNSSLLDSSSVMAAGPKCGKFRIGTYGSFSNSHLELEKEGKKSKVKNGLAADPVVKGPMSSPAVASPGSPFPLLQSPGMEWDRSDAGSEAPDDLDSTTTEDKFLSSSHDSERLGTDEKVWNHPVYHDHDYCSKEVSEEYLGKPAAPVPPVKTGKRKYVKKKDRLESEDEKLKKGKYLKRELLKPDNRFNLAAGRAESRAAAGRSSLLAESLTTKPNPVGRPRKRTEKQVEEYDAETGTKMKITGKYQDQYVYYLNKSSRNRRRKVDDKLTHGDKIILPAPKPGDIVVPHLSDADCEAIRRGGRMALLNNPSGSSGLPHTDSGDMDSSIVNTILSMETEHGNLHSPLSDYDGVGNATEDFADIEGNLTSEQVKMLFDCLEDCQMEETTISQELDLFTSAESVSVPSSTVDSLAATSVEANLIVPDVTQHPTGITAPSASLMGKVDPSSPAEVKQEQESLACDIKDIKRELGHTEPTPLVGGLPVPPTSQPSVEKNLEFLKTPFFPEVSEASTGSHGLFAPAPPTSMLSPLHESKEEVNDTPWIVTVTLYFNDIPAIVIINVPHVRLVDIHRQILPAKDTGILKKRCQLMSIKVSNCSEMQRYFLVQYGRAHNSKSTLVISKDEAQRLITYYAHPPPRNLRGEEGGPGGLRRSSSYAELRTIMERPPTNPPATRHSTLAFNQPRKRGGFRRRPLPTTRSHNPSPEPSVTTPSVVEPMVTPTPLPQPAAPTSPAKGLRHKKINFREMLKGEDPSSQLSPLVDGLADEDPALVADGPVAKGRASKAPTTTAAGGKKRRGSKEAAGAPPAKRGRKAWRKKADGLPEVTKKLTEAAEDRDSSLSSAKGKKRSPAANGGTLTASGRSPKSKYGPIKVNVKSLVSSGMSLSSDGTQPRKKNLFGRKSSSGSTDTLVVVDQSDREAARLRASSNPLRVLRISRQDVEASTPPTPKIHHSPSGEVHMDLYKRSSSACVKCGTCHKFLSVGNFLRHQHVGGEQVIGSTASVAGHQRCILVPMNKENISLQEQRLWNEFVVLQESLDHELGAGMAFPLTPLSPEASPVSSSFNMFGEVCSPGVDDSSPLMTMTPESPHAACLHNGHDDSGDAPRVVAVMSPDNEPCGDLSLSAVWDSQLAISPSPSFPLFSTSHTQNEEKCIDNDLDSNDTEIQSVDPKTIAPHNKKKQWAFQQPKRVSPTTSIRTSSRKRETKRLYSFEKYEFGAGGKKGGRAEVDTQDSEDDLADTLLDNVSVAMSNTVLHLASATALQESQNA